MGKEERRSVRDGESEKKGPSSDARKRGLWLVEKKRPPRFSLPVDGPRVVSQSALLWRTTRTTFTGNVDVDDDVDGIPKYSQRGEGRRSVLRRFALRRTSGTGENARASVVLRGEE